MSATARCQMAQVLEHSHSTTATESSSRQSRAPERRGGVGPACIRAGLFDSTVIQAAAAMRGVIQNASHGGVFISCARRFPRGSVFLTSPQKKQKIVTRSVKSSGPAGRVASNSKRAQRRFIGLALKPAHSIRIRARAPP